MKKALVIAAFVAVAGLAGCSDGVKRQPDTAVTFVHAATGLDDVSFLREQREESTVSFGTGRPFSFEVDQYDFNLAVADFTGAREIILTFSETLAANTDYFFVLVDSAGVPEILTFNAPHFDPLSTNAEVGVVHAAELAIPVDVFLEPDGTDLTTAVPLGSVEYKSELAPALRPPGDYRISLTEPGMPANLLYESVAVTLTAGQAYRLVLTDGQVPSLAPFSIAAMNAAEPTLLRDTRARDHLRVINAISDRVDRDIIIDGDTASPVFGALPFASAPDFALIDSGTHTVTVTPVGNPGVEEYTTTIGLVAGTESTLILAGEPAAITSAMGVENRRAITGQARLRLYNAAPGFGLAALYLTAPGVELDTVAPALLTSGPEVTADFSLLPADYAVAFRDYSSADVLAGPTDITVEGGKNYGVVVVPDAAGTAAEFVLIDDFN
jgi:Domain of unknown function (DUF4397)